MNILCPDCRSSLQLEEGVRLVRCSSCGFEADASTLGTAPGAPLLSVVRDMSGETLGVYRLQSMIGAGGMGVVYKAEDTREGRTVAVKVLNPDYQWKQDEFVQRFKREIKALGRLDHPGIVRILDSGEERGVHFLVTEFVDGTNLAELLKRGRMPIEEAVGIMTDVCEAIHFAHKQGVVHRDIKPANIIMAHGRAKLLDFGLAQVTGRESKITTLTRTDLAMGTFNYLSPEQRLSAKNVDHRADIFSLGVVFYEMLTGTLPLGSFAPPSKLRSEAPKRCDRIVTRSLQSSPELRYEDASALSADVRKIAQGSASRRLRRTAIAAALAFVAAGGILAFLFAGETPLPQEQATSNANKAGIGAEAPKEQTKSKIDAAEKQQALPASQQAPTQNAALTPTEPPPAPQTQGDSLLGLVNSNGRRGSKSDSLSDSTGGMGGSDPVKKESASSIKKPISKKSKADKAPPKKSSMKDPIDDEPMSKAEPTTTGDGKTKESKSFTKSKSGKMNQAVETK